MPEVKLKGGKLPAPVAEALEGYAADMFARPSGTWIAVVEISHAKRSEEVKTVDGYDFVAREVQVKVSSLEVASDGADQEAAQALLSALRERRESAGTLFDPAVRGAGS